MNDPQQRRRTGRARPPSADEASSPSTLLLPNAVLDVVTRPTSLSGAEERVLRAVDGFRPLARVRLKAGLPPDIFRAALRTLAEQRALRVVAIIEAADELLHGLADIAAPLPPEEASTMPRGSGDAIPAHVMAEIDAMLDEEKVRAAAASGLDDATEVEIALPSDD